MLLQSICVSRRTNSGRMQPDYFSSKKLMLLKASFKESEQSEAYGTSYQRYTEEFYAAR